MACRAGELLAMKKDQGREFVRDKRVKPITLKVVVYEGEEPVTNVETVIFD